MACTTVLPLTDSLLSRQRETFPLLRLGANDTHYHLITNTDVHIQTTTIENWAVLDGSGPLSGLSAEERAVMFDGFSDMVWESALRILRYRGDLSHSSSEE